MTNGEKILQTFPHSKAKHEGIVTKFIIDGYSYEFSTSWWNAEYKEPITENCIACKYDETEEEDSERCKKCLEGDSQFELDNEFVESTTKNDLGVDAVSRQAVLELIADYDLSMGQVVRGIHALPSVTPQEPRWIPASERLPEDHTNVLFCDIDGDVMLGYHIPREQKAHFVERGSWDMVKNVVAWMPLPESYKEVKDGN